MRPIDLHPRVQPREGIDVLIDAIAQLHRARAVTATLVGDGPNA
jgi:hypothetical protein